MFAGSATIISRLLFSNAYLASNSDGSSPASLNISQALDQAKLNPQVQRDAFAQAVTFSLQQREPQATANLADAAALTEDTLVFTAAFAKVGLESGLAIPHTLDFG